MTCINTMAIVLVLAATFGCRDSDAGLGECLLSELPRIDELSVTNTEVTCRFFDNKGPHSRRVCVVVESDEEELDILLPFVDALSEFEAINSVQAIRPRIPEDLLNESKSVAVFGESTICAFGSVKSKARDEHFSVWVLYSKESKTVYFDYQWLY